MINAVIIDNNEKNRELLTSHLEKIDDVKIYGTYCDIATFKSSDITYGDIDLIIFDINSKNADEILYELKKLKTKHNNLNFIGSSYEINSELVTKVLKEIARDFLLKPVIPNILEAAINKIKDIKDNVPLKKANTICVYSNKGGTGKTSVAINIAYEISKLTKGKVCLLDLTSSATDVNTFLNIDSKFNADFIINNLETSDEKLLLSLLNNYKESNLYTFSPNEKMDLSSKLAQNEMIKIINAMKHIFSYVIIDTTSVMDETILSILNNSDLILFVSMLNMSSIKNTQRCFELFKNIGYKDDKIKLVINRFIENSNISINDMEKITGKQIFQKIPNNYLTLVDAINQGGAVGETNPQSNIAKSFKNLAKDILNIDFLSLASDNKTNFNHGIFNLLRRMGE